MQSAKIIDVTRTFIPVDPNTFPETLHGTQKEDFPEQRFPVVPYMGHNFLPTAYGYRSYFGTNAALDILTLAPNKPDRIFMFQSLTYRNILVALCDTGIWYKDSSVTGAWEQAVALPAPGEFEFYEWYATIIKNKLYVYRNNGEGYYVIETDPLADQGVTLETKIPTFITPNQQLGMSRLGSRLVFWDANNAIAWSSPDDLNDFTPAILTGANVTTFNSIVGKISNILPHGKHAIAYASKSITLLQVEPGETFLVRAAPIMPNVGVPYQRQAVASSPDTIHFCYADTGIFKIEAGKPEQIVPEFYDYLKPYNAQPVYLKMLQGRYLCFEMLDPNAVDGNAIFSKTVIPASELLFSALPNTLEEIHESAVVDVQMCEVIQALPQDAFDEQAAAASAAVPDELRKPGTDVQPLYTCYLSLGNGPVVPITWSAVPCGAAKPSGGTFEASPADDGGKLSKWTTDSTNKTAKTGAESFIDGKWTMERFVQYQTAVWQTQEKMQAAFLRELLAHTDGDNVQTPVPVCAASTNLSYCDIGRYPTEFSPYQFGFNICSFWLTRYALAATDVKNQVNRTISCALNEVTLSAADSYRATFDGTVAGSVGGLEAHMNTLNFGGRKPYTAVLPGGDGNLSTAQTYSYGGNNYVCFNVNTSKWREADGGDLGTAGTIMMCALIPAGYAYDRTSGVIGNYPNFPSVVVRNVANPYIKTEAATSENIEEPVAALTPTPETAYCELTGYAYTDVNGNAATMPVAGGCQLTADKYPKSLTATRVVPNGEGRDNMLDADGSICGLPFDFSPEVSLLPDVEWLDQTVTYPRSEFLVQQGSIAPKYPTIYGAFVYDLALKKWGKMKGEYKQLLDYSPINSGAGAPIGFDTFGILAGLIKADGFVYLFDNAPTDSRITWGKIGYYRLGMTEPHEVRVDFASSSSGTVTVEASEDGTNLAEGWSTSKTFSGRSVVIYPDYSGKWHNVTVSGRYDITHLQFRGEVKGRR